MLPQATESFLTRKSKILSQLSVPDAEYTDASPKGSVDVAIRELIDEINHGYQGLVTTSSCAGRVSVYVEGVKKKKKSKSGKGTEVEVELEEEKETAEEGQEGGGRASSSGGKGGGEWLFVSHDPLETVDPSTGKGYDGKHWMEIFGLTSSGSKEISAEAEEEQEQERLIHFKFEPMILHILTTSPSHAHLAIQSGMTSGFRETGAVSILPRLPASSGSSNHQPSSPTSSAETPNPIVAIRSMGLSFESLIGVQRGTHRQSLVTPEYLSLLVKIANERFEENKKRIARFREALRLAFSGEGSGVCCIEEKKKVGDSGEWEDAEARKQRKREEGLARREEVRKRKEEERERKRREAEEAEKKKKEEEEGKTTWADVVLQVPDVL